MAFNIKSLPIQSGISKDGASFVAVCNVPLPARLDAAHVAFLLGFGEHDIPVLIAAGLLKPLGKPVQNAVKYFAASHIEMCGNDPKWLIEATQLVYDHWRGKNARKTSRALAAAA